MPQNEGTRRTFMKAAAIAGAGAVIVPFPLSFPVWAGAPADDRKKVGLVGCRAAILSIGDELTLGQISERNARWIAQEFLRHGVLVMEHRTVSDDRASIASALTQLAQND